MWLTHEWNERVNISHSTWIVHFTRFLHNILFQKWLRSNFPNPISRLPISQIPSLNTQFVSLMRDLVQRRESAGLSIDHLVVTGYRICCVAEMGLEHGLPSAECNKLSKLSHSCVFSRCKWQSRNITHSRDKFQPHIQAKLCLLLRMNEKCLFFNTISIPKWKLSN